MKKKPGWKKKMKKKKKKKGGGGGEKKKQSAVNAYIDITAFHTHSNNHKSYKIILITTWQSEKHKYCQDNQKSTK